MNRRVYYGARYYDAQLSRWISADPALVKSKYFPKPQDFDTDHDYDWYDTNSKIDELPGLGGIYNPINLDLYCYAHNNPIRFIDPDGNAVSIAIQKQSQLSLFRHGLEPAKKGCWYSSMMMMVSGLAGKTVDQNKVWDKAVKVGYINSENAQVVNPSGLANLGGVKATWSGKIKASANRIKEQLDKGMLVQAILSDGHSEVINGYKYDNGKLLFTVVDPGYQKDKIIDGSTLKAYVDYPKQSSTPHGSGKGFRKVESISYFIKKGK